MPFPLEWREIAETSQIERAGLVVVVLLHVPHDLHKSIDYVRIHYPGTHQVLLG